MIQLPRWPTLLWHLLYWAWVASELLTVVLTYTRRDAGAVQDRGTMRLLWIVILCSLWTGIWFGATHRHTLFGGAPWVFDVSLLLLAAGLAMRWTAILSLGRAFSVNVAILDGQRVKRDGLYRWVRHPSYSAMLILFLAVGLGTLNWISLAIVCVPTTLAILYRIRIEEQALRRGFGQEYIDYSASTRRLIPGVY